MVRDHWECWALWLRQVVDDVHKGVVGAGSVMVGAKLERVSTNKHCHIMVREAWVLNFESSCKK